MDTIELYTTCQGCNGTGEVTKNLTGGGTEVTDCPDCGGTGRMFYADSASLTTALEDLLDKANDILDKCNDILEELNE